MSERRIDNYDEFWKFYVREHSNKTNRRLHFLGSTGALACVTAAIVKRDPKLILAALVAGYGGAWVGHFVFEKNTPATFKYPLWSFISDWKMYAKILTGQMDQVVAEEMAAHEQKLRDEAEAAARSESANAESATRSADLN